MMGRVGAEDGSHQQVYGQAMEHRWLPLLEIWKPSLIYLLGEWSLIEILYKNEKTTATKYLRTIFPPDRVRPIHHPSGKGGGDFPSDRSWQGI